MSLWILSGATRVSQHQKGKTKTILDFLEQETLSGNIQDFYARQRNYSAYMLWQFRLSVCPSVCLSHGWISQKQLKLGSRSFHRTVSPSL